MWRHDVVWRHGMTSQNDVMTSNNVSMAKTTMTYMREVRQRWGIFIDGQFGIIGNIWIIWKVGNIEIIIKWSNLTLLSAHLPLFGILIWPCPLWALTLTHVAFDLQPKSNSSRDMNFYLVNFYLLHYFLVTDRQMDRQKAMHKSPPCISTGGLKNNRNIKILDLWPPA